jgi:site-specific DNA-cytosine methylase
VRLEEPVILHENVKSFKVSLLEDMLGHKYSIESTVSSLQAQGWPVERERKYTILHHRVKAPTLRQSMMLTTSVFQRDCRIGCLDFFLATEEELEEEVSWAVRSKRKSPAHADFKANGRLPEGDDRFEKCLAPGEHSYLEQYRKLFRHQQVWQLNQNPLKHPQHSKGNVLHTLIKNAGCLWSDHARRWYTPRELLLFQGYPAYEKISVACSGASCSFIMRRTSERSHFAFLGQVGNSFNLHQIGVFHLWIAAFTTILDGHPLFQALSSRGSHGGPAILPEENDAGEMETAPGCAGPKKKLRKHA